MSTTIFSNDIRDTNTYSASQRRYGTNTDVLYDVVNNLDAEVTVTFYGTRFEDESNDDVEQLGQLVVSASGSGYETLSDPWEKVYIEVVASTAPTDGEATIYRMQ